MSSYGGVLLKLDDKGNKLNKRYFVKDEQGFAYYAKVPETSIVE